jgi:predicted MFS family arabinose efflux permease
MQRYRDTRAAVSDKEGIPSGSGWLLALLVAVHTCNWMDRYLATILIEPMKRDLHLSDTQLGIITGFGFSLVYSLAALPIARIVDYGPRKALLSAFVGAWSAATMLASMATGFISLASARLVVAAAESGCSPTAYSLIADSFPYRFRGRAVSLYALGVPFGAWAGLMLGGVVNDLVGWRATFLFIGAPGLLLALITLLRMRDPPRGDFDSATSRFRAYTLLEALQFMRGSRAFVLSCVSIGLLAITTSSFQGWAPTFLIRSQGLSSSMVGTLSGTLSGFGGVIGALLAGFLADHLGRRNPRWYLWLPMLGAAILLPSEQLFLRTQGAVGFVFYFLTILAAGTYVAPLFTLCQILLPTRIRAFGSAVMLLVINLVGMGGGIFAAGALSDLFHRDGLTHPLGMALQCLQVGAVLAICTLACAAIWVKDDAAALC